MNTTIRFTRIPRLSWFSLVVLPFALAACGGDSADARTTTTKPKTTTTPSTGETTTKVTTVSNPSGGGRTRSSKVSDAVPATYENADAFFKDKRYPEAEALFDRFVGTNPESLDGQYMLGLSAWKAGDLKRAEEAFDKALAIDPKHVKSYLNSARVLLDMNRAPEAMERLEKVLVLDSVSSDGLRLKARAQAELKDVDGARATYMKALVLNDQDTWAMNNLGVLELNSGDVSGSVGPLARAVQLNPTAPIFQNNLGMALERSGHRVAALRAYEAAVKADSTYAKAVKNSQRLAAVVTDTTENDGFSVRDAAEQFRLEVKTWKDGVAPSVPKVRPPMLPLDDTVGVQVQGCGW